MNSTQITSLTLLASATAAYESAWRTSCGVSSLVWDPEAQRHVANPAYSECSAAMNAAHRRVTSAIKALIGSGLDAETVHAMHAALVLATVNVSGERKIDGSPVHASDGMREQWMRTWIAEAL